METNSQVIVSTEGLIKVLDTIVENGWRLDYPTHEDEPYRVGWISPDGRHAGDFSWGIVAEHCRKELIGVDTSIKKMLRSVSATGLETLEADNPLRDWLDKTSAEFLAKW